MKRSLRLFAPFAILLISGCGGGEKAKGEPVVSREPISVRGWITDVEGSSNGPYHTAETEAARKSALFQSVNVYVDGAPYVSGGVAETGAFLLLDVPPGNVTITFTAPGAGDSKLVMQKIPGNADVFLPSVLLAPATARLLDPAAVRVRLAARVDKAKPTGAIVSIAGQSIPVLETPIGEMTDRHDFPTPPGSSMAPLATVK